MRYRDRGHKSQRSTAAKASVLMLAFLPSLLFFGHPLTPEGERSAPQSPIASSHPEDGHDHGTHCHEGLAGCSDQPVTSGPSLFLLAEVIAADTPDTRSATGAERASRPAEPAYQPAPPPPRTT